VQRLIELEARMAKSFKDYEHEGWNSKASHYAQFTLPSPAKASNQS
jgi:hypothetical protein